MCVCVYCVSWGVKCVLEKWVGHLLVYIQAEGKVGRAGMQSRGRVLNRAAVILLTEAGSL